MASCIHSDSDSDAVLTLFNLTALECFCFVPDTDKTPLSVRKRGVFCEICLSVGGTGAKTGGLFCVGAKTGESEFSAMTTGEEVKNA